MIGWIKRQLGRGVHAVEDLLDRARDAFLAVWRTLERVFDIVRRSWHKVTNGLGWFGSAVVGLAHRLYDTTRGLVLHVIPRAIKAAINALHKVVNRAIGAARDLARGLYRTLRDWASKAINAVAGWLGDVWDWTLRHVNDLLDRARRFWDRVADLVLHPEKLAAWILPHLLRPLLAFLVSVGAKIGRWMLERSVHAALTTANVLESIIVRIL